MFFRSCALIVLFSLIIYWFQIRLTQEDLSHYQKLAETTLPLPPEHAFQMRTGVQKDIWTENEKEHLHIESEASELTLYPQEGEIVERLKAIHSKIRGTNLIANEGTYRFPSNDLALKGDVKWLGNASCAIADELTYDPLEHTILLSSYTRVLLSQEGLSLSAPEVLIKKDQSVEGHGDVHFDFDLEEQNSINQLLEKYI